MLMVGKRRRIGDILLDLGHINDSQLKEAIAEQEHTGPDAPLIGDILKLKGYVTDSQLDEAFLLSLDEVMQSSEIDRFVKHLAYISATAVRKNGVGLSKESLLAIIVRIDHYKERIARLNESQTTLGRMRRSAPLEKQMAENAAQIAECEDKIRILRADLRAQTGAMAGD